ncbi:MAG TPA: DUF86 domain-containing protein [Methanosarcinaceae archaeon]|nr:DUF86 domain-containing protein [Methanosarcinaceae archaeon]HJH31121.1 DUF86 domain-containing protein [Methanosarcinaceae archaeon]
MSDEIASKLELLEEYVSYLREYQYYDMEDMMSDHTLKGAVERYIEVALECMIDIGEMIISREKLKRPDTYRDVFLVLGEHGILPEKFAINLAPAAGFRNVLVHMYSKIDVEKLHYYLENNLEDIEQFGKHIAQYLIKP